MTDPSAVISSPVAKVPGGYLRSSYLCRNVREQRFAHHLAHGDQVGGRGFVVVDGALAHHIGAHGAVRDLRAHVQRLGAAVQRVEVFGEGFPIPLDALGQHRAGNVLHPLHDLDEPVAAVGLHGGEAHAAIAHDGRGDAMPGGRAEVGIPGGLAVVVGMDVHPARRHQAAVGPDLAPGGAGLAFRLDDAAAVDGEVARVAGLARTIDDRAAAYDQIMHCALL
jgi:hypothetical protein